MIEAVVVLCVVSTLLPHRVQKGLIKINMVNAVARLLNANIPGIKIFSQFINIHVTCRRNPPFTYLPCLVLKKNTFVSKVLLDPFPFLKISGN